MEYHEVSDVIKINKRGDPRYYRIIKITPKCYVVKKCPIHLVDQIESSKHIGRRYWIDWEDNLSYDSPQTWVDGPEVTYIPKKEYPLYTGKYWWINKLFKKF